ncbi:anti-sigma factor domain-containing protein [Agrobacterium tumefaciens]|uniref:anti-sigma factor n=1 Tax=Agrobacterium tumefaciens TaxID=358 RepID=UPI00287E4B7C|nr:anti-sigma factor [Agrobacterium tumefaciens]MDS7594827.1 anti-sigma factor [Agrobacterium tumefaciens]
MTGDPHNGGMNSRDEILAGEYVLGVVSLEKRREIEKRIVEDKAFASLVERWQAELAAFNEDYHDEVPDAAILARIEERLFGRANQDTRSGLWSSVTFWRWLSLGTSAIAVAAIAFALLPTIRQDRSTPLVAELATTDSQVNLLASYDTESGRVRIVPVAVGRPDEKSLELWLVQKNGSTRSLGVFQPGTNGDLIIPADMRASISEGTTFAVSVEPFGGSPTGQATGPVIAVGTARHL